MPSKARPRRVVMPIRSTHWNTSAVPDQFSDQSRTFEWLEYVYYGPNYPHWRDRLAQGLQTTTSMSAFKRNLKYPVGGYLNVGYLSPIHGASVSFGALAARATMGLIPTEGVQDFNLELKEQAIGQATSNFIKSYREAVTQWQAGTFIGELKETVRFLVSPLKTLERRTIDLGKGLKKLKYKLANAQRREEAWLRAGTDSYLAYKFGVKPLLQDIHDAHKALISVQEHIDKNVIPLIGSGKVVSSYGPIERTVLDCFNSASCYVDEAATNKFTCLYKGGYKPSTASGELPFWDSLGLSPDQWAPTIWEIIPSSFIWDYFVNAQAVIDAVSFQMVSLRWISRTIRQTHTRTFSGQRNGPIVAPYKTAYGGALIDESILCQREALSELPVPPIRFKLPGLTQSLNLAALANGLEGLKAPPGHVYK